MSFHIENSTDNFGVLTTATLNAENISANTAIIDILTINDDVDVTGNLDVGGKLNVTGDVEVGGNLDVTGDVMAGNIASDDTITAMGNISTEAAITAIGNISTEAAITAMGNISSEADITAIGNISSEADITAIGDITSQADITAIGTVSSQTIMATSDVAEPTTVYMTQTTSTGTIASNVPDTAGLFVATGGPGGWSWIWALVAVYEVGRIGGSISIQSTSNGAAICIPKYTRLGITIPTLPEQGITSSTKGIASLGNGAQNINFAGLSAYGLICGENTATVFLGTFNEVDIPAESAEVPATIDVNFIFFQPAV